MKNTGHSGKGSCDNSQKITLSDVAKAAGVSVITVSRVLNKPELVSKKTLARVKKVIQELGYVPNLLAGNLKSNRSRLIVVLVPTIAGSPFLKSVQVFMDYVTQAGYQVMIGQTGYDNSQQESLLDVIIGRRPDGVVIAGRVSSEAARRKLIVAGIPIVETWQINKNPVDMMVGFSHQAVGRAVADHLWECQHRDYAVIVGSDERGQQRLAGFRARLKELHQQDKNNNDNQYSILTYHVQVPSTVAAGREILSWILQEGISIDAVVSCSDAVAVGVLFEAQARDIEIPARLAVIGYGDTEMAAYTVPALSTVKIDGHAIGLEAAKMIIARAEGKEVLQPIKDIGFSIKQRETT